MSAPSTATIHSAARRLFEEYQDLSSEEYIACLDVLAAAGTWYDEPRGRWLVGRADDARTALSHSQLLNDLRIARPATKSWQLSNRVSERAVPLLFVDPPLHGPARAVLARYFSVSIAKNLAAELAVYAAEWVARVRAFASFDLASDLAQPFAVDVMSRSMGFRRLAAPVVTNLIDDLFSYNQLFDLRAGAEVLRAAEHAQKRIHDFVLAEMAPDPRLDLPRLNSEERDLVIASLEFSLRAGVVTMSCLMVEVLLRLFASPAPTLTDKPIHTAVAAATPTLEAGRITASKVSLNGAIIPAHETVICLLPAANRDLIRRGGRIRDQLTFGGGRHRCIGEPFVYAALDAVVAAMRRAGARIRALGEGEVHRTPSFRGMRVLPVEWVS